jgi:probable phosphoglycerate mutase
MSRSPIYYVRHGETDWNVQHRLQGRHDVPLNDKGRVQAVRCAEVLRDLLERDGLRAADCGYVSSPLIRARETMGIMRTALGLAPEGIAIEPRLAEISFGEWEGLTYPEILARDRDIVSTRENNKWLFRPPGGETYEEVAQRVGAWHATLDRPTVVTAHGGTARAMIALLGVASHDGAVHHSIDHGVVYVFNGRSLKRYE